MYLNDSVIGSFDIIKIVFLNKFARFQTVISHPVILFPDLHSNRHCNKNGLPRTNGKLLHVFSSRLKSHVDAYFKK